MEAAVKETIQEKRARLKQLSAVAKEMMDAGEIEAEGVNEALEVLYSRQGHTEIHTFRGWLDKGFVVKRGEKALLLWGKPQKAADQQAPAKENGEPDEYRFYPLAFVFSNLQVEPRITKHTAR